MPGRTVLHYVKKTVQLYMPGIRGGRISNLIIIFFLSAIQVYSATAQTPGKTIVTKQWNAYWIAAKNDPGREYGIYYFRKHINLPAKPAVFKVKLSADNRYKLYVNGALVSLGPARGDTYYWNYETVDIAPFLTTGDNAIAAVVWNEAEYRPEAQISLRTGFILQGDSADSEVLNTDTSWRCMRDTAYAPLTGIGYHPYYVAGPGEIISMAKTVKGWSDKNFDDTAWPFAGMLGHGKPKGQPDAFGWMLVPSSIPQMERTYQRIPLLREATGVIVPKGFPAAKVPVTIPARTVATLLLDQTFLTSAYVTLNFSGGKDGTISLTYAEAPFDNLAKYGARKGNRNDVAGKDIVGRKDSLIADGTSGQVFNSLYWRTYRYIKIRIETKDAPLVINDIYGTFTAYPLRLNAKLQTADTTLQKILDIGWRTARLDALETYMDCPYYEQLQYVGDTRIQAMISYYNSGDDRLARNAINLMDHSRIAEGLTLSRHPSYSPQIISTFSLWYIGMLHDYWMYRPDSLFVKSKLSGERSVLDFFSRYQQADGSLNGTPYWTFVDWADGKNWNGGSPPVGKQGGSAILDLQLLLAYQSAAEMERQIGLPELAHDYQLKAVQLKQTIQSKYWDAGRMQYADTEDKDLFSQHANSLAVLAKLVNGKQAEAFGEKLLSDTTLTQCTIYFKYYLHQVLVKCGLGDCYLSWLGIWRKNIAEGLTTWAEFSDLANTRSDCHAWGASPNIEFFRTVLGIDSYAPGFSKISIEPHLGNITQISGSIPHPEGTISVAYKQNGRLLHAMVTLPQNIPGRFIWHGETRPLHGGKNIFTLPLN